MKKFEFILSINGNIICQRYFSVKNFNPKVLRSVDLTECVEECVRLIQKDLKNKTDKEISDYCVSCGQCCFFGRAKCSKLSVI